jgi:hypothetical protein
MRMICISINPIVSQSERRPKGRSAAASGRKNRSLISSVKPRRSMLFPDLVSVNTLIAQLAQGAWSDPRHPDRYRGVAVVAPNALVTPTCCGRFCRTEMGADKDDRASANFTACYCKICTARKVFGCSDNDKLHSCIYREHQNGRGLANNTYATAFSCQHHNSCI